MEKAAMVPILAAVVLVIFIAGLGLSYFFGDSSMMNMMIGATISMATQVIQYYFGSSAGSQKKDDTIAQAALGQTGKAP